MDADLRIAEREHAQQNTDESFRALNLARERSGLPWLGDPRKFPHDHGDCLVSDFKVMRSPAGYYVGRTCWDKAGGYEEPYSRDSDYMPEKEAQADLARGLYS